MGRSGLDVIKDQVLVESADFRGGYWVPILAILCDRVNSNFLALDSVKQQAYSSGCTTGLIVNEHSDKSELLVSAKRIVGYLFDWFSFVMVYVNGIRALGYKSSNHKKYKKMPSTEKWEQALILAERSQGILQDAARRVNYRKYNEAEQLAEDGLETLKESLSKLSHGYSQEKPLEAVWPGDKYVEECFDPMKLWNS